MGFFILFSNEKSGNHLIPPFFLQYFNTSSSQKQVIIVSSLSRILLGCGNKSAFTYCDLSCCHSLMVPWHLLLSHTVWCDTIMGDRCVFVSILYLKKNIFSYSISHEIGVRGSNLLLSGDFELSFFTALFRLSDDVA